MKLSFKRWRFGLRVACLMGLCSGIIGVVVDAPWKVTLVFVVASIAREVQRYINDNPISEIEETQIISKQ